VPVANPKTAKVAAPDFQAEEYNMREFSKNIHRLFVKIADLRSTEIVPELFLSMDIALKEQDTGYESFDKTLPCSQTQEKSVRLSGLISFSC
jgi:hypothetical protein